MICCSDAESASASFECMLVFRLFESHKNGIVSYHERALYQLAVGSQSSDLLAETYWVTVL